MAADVHKVYGQKGAEYHVYTASGDSAYSGGMGFCLVIDSDTAATNTPKTKGEVIAILKGIVQYYEENDYPPA
ncbi:MAG: hypothetical protein K0U84_13375 [Actinomycetia bacterium]|nr:hypothetical protein [Actinomycetes bacterium]